MNQKAGLKQYDHFIGGRAVRPLAGKYSVDLNPATEQPIAEVASGDKADVDAAVAAAEAAFNGWSTMRAAERGRILNLAAQLIEQHQDELTEIESLDAGKPLAAVKRQDIPAVIDMLRRHAGWCDKITGQVVPTRPDALTRTVREPVGVVGAIIPWNFPLMIGM